MSRLNSECPNSYIYVLKYFSPPRSRHKSIFENIHRIHNQNLATQHSNSNNFLLFATNKYIWANGMNTRYGHKK